LAFVLLVAGHVRGIDKGAGCPSSHTKKLLSEREHRPDEAILDACIQQIRTAFRGLQIQRMRKEAGEYLVLLQRSPENVHPTNSAIQFVSNHCQSQDLFVFVKFEFVLFDTRNTWTAATAMRMESGSLPDKSQVAPLVPKRSNPSPPLALRFESRLSSRSNSGRCSLPDQTDIGRHPPLPPFETDPNCGPRISPSHQ